MIASQLTLRPGRYAPLALLAVLLLSVGAAAADMEPGAFEPPPDEFDWVQLVSDEWLKGEIVAMYDGSLEFDSDELDELTLDLEDIKRIRSAGTMQVGLLDGTVAQGQLLLDGDEVRVRGAEDLEFERSQIVSITSGAATERNYWSGAIGAGANLRRGNTEQLEGNARVALRRRTVRNRVGLDYLGNYSVTNEVTTADSQRANAAWDHFLSDRFFVSPLQAEYFRDPFQNVAHRYTIGAGAGYQLVDTSKVDWSLTAGLAYQNTRFDDVPEGEATSASTLALGVGTSYDREVTGSIDFNLRYHFFVVDEESGLYTHNLVTGLEFDLTSSLDFFVTLVWDRIERPRPGADGTLPKKDDLRLNLGLSLDF